MKPFNLWLSLLLRSHLYENELKTNSQYKVNGKSQTNMKGMSSLEMRNEFEYANLKEDNSIVSEELTTKFE